MVRIKVRREEAAASVDTFELKADKMRSIQQSMCLMIRYSEQAV
jgi:hypothetical protein